MGGEVCYRKNYERGPWYALKALREHIAGRDARGEDTSWYREIYKSWLTYPEYARADKENRDRGLYGVLANVGDKREPVTKQKHGENHVTPPDFDILKDSRVVLKHPGGRPRKPDNLSRSTAWRREKERQGVLL